MEGLKIARGSPLASLIKTYSASDLVKVYVLGRPSRREGAIASSCSSVIQLHEKYNSKLEGKFLIKLMGAV